MSEQEDAKLKEFFRSHGPGVPVAPSNEFDSIVAKIGVDEPKHSFLYTPWFAFSGVGALVASFVTAWVLLNTPPKIDGDASTAVVAGQSVNVSTEDADTDVVPTVNVGEEFLALVDD